MIRRRIRALALAAALLAAAGCRGEPADARTPAAQPRAAASPTGWRATPNAEVDLATAGDSLVVETGPHAVLWRAPAAGLAPPYTVRAVFEKRRGRLHEGYGLVFGASGLEGPEAGQAYAYFLVRGDGSFLVKRRQGLETPVVIDWTRQAVIRRDQEETGRPNALEVRVTAGDVAFFVNGAEVARVPAAGLPLAGVAGVRTAHEVSLVVRGFRAEPGARP